MQTHSEHQTTHGNATQAGHEDHQNHAGEGGHYLRFALMLLFSFIAMFILMYAMVDRLPNAVPNLNQAYMAALMTAPMLVLELLLMGRMYPDKRKNLALIAGGVLLLGASWFAIRMQTAIDDEQFLKSMIPHHAGAILMCKEANLQRPDVKQLCDEIIVAQEQEIALMRKMLGDQSP